MSALLSHDSAEVVPIHAETTARLRAKAEQVRSLARSFFDDPAVQQLLDLADELDARAVALEPEVPTVQGDIFHLAVERASSPYRDANWASLTLAEQAAAIYREMRDLDSKTSGKP
jgi:hypothetical protein